MQKVICKMLKARPSWMPQERIVINRRHLEKYQKIFKRIRK